MDGLCVFLFALICQSASSDSHSTHAIPEWRPGRELVYRGTIREEAQAAGGRFTKEFRLELRCYALDASVPGPHQLGCMTKLGLAAPSQERPESAAVRLDILTLRTGGFQNLPAPQHPIEEFRGPECAEFGYLFVPPAGACPGGGPWQWTTSGEPAGELRCAGLVSLDGRTFWKLELTQESPEWTQPRGDRAGWRRITEFWLDPRTGVTHQHRRTLLGKPAAHQSATYSLVTEYVLENQTQYEGVFHQDRQREIEAHARFQSQIAALHAANTPAGLFALSERIDSFLRGQPATPYRDALIYLRKDALAATKRQLPAPLSPSQRPQSARIEVGQPFPQLVFPALAGETPLDPSQWPDRLTLVVFFHPQSVSTPAVLPELEKLQRTDAEQGKLAIMALSLREEPEALRAYQHQFNLTVPLGFAIPARHKLTLTETPQFVWIGPTGKVAAIRTGWGPESPSQLARDMRKLAVHEGAPADPQGLPSLQDR